MPISDHYDGKKFFNPWSIEEDKRNFWDAAKWLWNRNPAPWPEYIEIEPQKVAQERVGEGELSLTFINHSTVLIQTDHYNILTDPIWSERASPVSWYGPKRVHQPGVRFEDLPPIDIVLVSHNHYDHLDLPTLKLLKKKFNPLIITSLGNKKFLKSEGFSRVEELDWWMSIQPSSTLTIYSVPAKHFSSRTPFDRNETLWTGFWVQTPNYSIYFAGDTGYGPHFKEMYERLGVPDVALLPVGAFKPRWFMSPVHTSPAEAVQASVDLHAKTSIGIHFGTFRLGDEAYDEPQEEVNKTLKEKGLSVEHFLLLKPGESRKLD